MWAALLDHMELALQRAIYDMLGSEGLQQMGELEPEEER